MDSCILSKKLPVHELEILIVRSQIFPHSLHRRRPCSRQHHYQEALRRWLVSGEFLEVDEGNRAVRATIGFGKGATAMDVAVSVSDLENRPNEPFMVFGTAKTAGKMPGAVVTMNPFVAAGKFVMEKNASDKDIKKTAEQIATQIIQQGVLKPAPVK